MVKFIEARTGKPFLGPAREAMATSRRPRRCASKAMDCAGAPGAGELLRLDRVDRADQQLHAGHAEIVDYFQAVKDESPRASPPARAR
jgi:hypothetical protein